MMDDIDFKVDVTDYTVSDSGRGFYFTQWRGNDLRHESSPIYKTQVEAQQAAIKYDEDGEPRDEDGYSYEQELHDAEKPVGSNW